MSQRTYLPGIANHAQQKLGWDQAFKEGLTRSEKETQNVNHTSKVARISSAHEVFSDVKEIHQALVKLESTRSKRGTGLVLEDKIKQIEAYSNLHIRLFQALTKISKLSNYAGHQSFAVLNKYAKATREALSTLLGDTDEKINSSSNSKGITGVLGRIFNPDFKVVGA